MWSDDPVGKEFVKVLVALKMKRPGLSFYALRHTFSTVGQKTRDRDAVASIMGHTPHVDDMEAKHNDGSSGSNKLKLQI